MVAALVSLLPESELDVASEPFVLGFELPEDSDADFVLDSELPEDSAVASAFRLSVI